MSIMPRLGATELAASQAIPESTVNENLRYVEQGAGFFIVKDKDQAAPPGSPAQGDAYIVAGSPSGVWTGHAKDIAFYMNTAWAFITPIEGTRAAVQDEDIDYRYSGSAWAVAAAPGLGTASTLDFDTDGTLAANSDAKIATQKATRTYVDARVNGNSWKQAVRAATTANGTLATAFENGDTIDGVTLATGDRILLKNQSSGAENGIYVVAASGAPARASDADSGAELVNASVYVSEGTTLADTQWTCSTNAPISVGSTALTWAQFISGSYTDENARDAIGAMLADSSTIDVTYNDAGDAETFDVIQTALKPTESLIIAVGDETTAITTGTAKVTFRMPYALTLTDVRASLTTVSSSGTPTVDINEAGATILSTKLTIDASEKTSTTAATAAVISDASLADDAEMTIDIDTAGTGAAGLKVYLIGHRT